MRPKAKSGTTDTQATKRKRMNARTKRYSCKECDSAFPTTGELIRHVRYKHTHEKPYKCQECEYASVELSKLRRHMRSHTGERPYQCEHCAYTCSDSFKLKRHTRIHTGERPYLCSVCGASFTQSDTLKAHSMTHMNARPSFSCQFCSVKCNRETELKTHMQKMHASKTVNCRKCEMEFPDRYSYRVHLQTHRKHRYKCDVCGYTTKEHQSYQTHMSHHKNVKPFKCDVCKQTFALAMSLKKHVNWYHRPHYSHRPTKEKLLRCEVCHRPYLHMISLLRHLEEVHKVSVGDTEVYEGMALGGTLLVENSNQEDGEVKPFPVVMVEGCKIEATESIPDMPEFQVTWEVNDEVITPDILDDEGEGTIESSEDAGCVDGTSKGWGKLRKHPATSAKRTQPASGLQPKRRGRPRKNPASCLPADPADPSPAVKEERIETNGSVQTEESQPRRRGRPRKRPALSPSAEPRDPCAGKVEEKPVIPTIETPLGQPKQRGRPRKHPQPSSTAPTNVKTEPDAKSESRLDLASIKTEPETTDADPIADLET